MSIINDQMSNDILRDLREEKNNAFGQLYANYFGMVDRFVIHNSGQSTDAEDLFQDTMVILLEKLRQDNFVLTASLKTYIMAIAKNLWLKRLSAGKNLEFSDLSESYFLEDLHSFIDQERSYWDRLQDYLLKITDHCQGLIEKIFFRNKTMEQIQQEYGYSTRHNAQNQKHKCMEQIRMAKQGHAKNKQETALLHIPK